MSFELKELPFDKSIEQSERDSLVENEGINKSNLI